MSEGKYYNIDEVREAHQNIVQLESANAEIDRLTAEVSSLNDERSIKYPYYSRQDKRIAKLGADNKIMREALENIRLASMCIAARCGGPYIEIAAEALQEVDKDSNYTVGPYADYPEGD